MNRRIAYLDTVRLAAMVLMIVCHACDPFNAGATYGEGEVDQEMFLWGSIWGSCVRACVPLFIMLTGALCLTTEQPMQVGIEINRKMRTFVQQTEESNGHEY